MLPQNAYTEIENYCILVNVTYHRVKIYLYCHLSKLKTLEIGGNNFSLHLFIRHIDTVVYRCMQRVQKHETKIFNKRAI